MIYVLMGPSGAGKTTLGNRLKLYGIQELVSHTTRSPRRGETEGDPYYFVTREEFNKIDMIETTEYAGNIYGTSKKEVDDKIVRCNSVFIIADKNGAEQFRELYGDIVKVVYIYASIETIKNRMKARGDTDEDVEKRVSNAIKQGEFNNIHKADYCIINNDLDESIRLIQSIMA